MVSVTDGSSFNAGLLSMPSMATDEDDPLARSRMWLLPEFVWKEPTDVLTALIGDKGTEEDKEDRGEVRRVILAGGVSGDVLLKRSQVGSVFAL